MGWNASENPPVADLRVAGERSSVPVSNVPDAAVLSIRQGAAGSLRGHPLKVAGCRAR